MDPNETLRLLREALEGVTHAQAPDDEYRSAVDAASYAAELDQWLSNGGVLPREWSKQS